MLVFLQHLIHLPFLANEIYQQVVNCMNLESDGLRQLTCTLPLGDSLITHLITHLITLFLHKNELLGTLHFMVSERINATLHICVS